MARLFCMRRRRAALGAATPQQEKEKYLLELEAAGELAPHMRLLKPQPGCCAALWLRHGSGARQRLFLNIGQSPKMNDFYFKDEMPPGRGEREAQSQQSVCLPFSLGPPRPDKQDGTETVPRGGLRPNSRVGVIGGRGPVETPALL
eukprot:GHVT01067716.1.p1 GENE.GHVT01067716.1~~GHVT01067716.1.p1  ORF type:complete len:146 (+),score=30.20 GHVT01067716.1:833-1270(+)